MIFKNFTSFVRKGKYFIYLKYSFLVGKLGLRQECKKSVKYISEWTISLKVANKNSPLIVSNTSRDNIIIEADKILEHQFTFLGEDLFMSPKAIDWHLDPISKYRFPNHIWYRSFKKHNPTGVDRKYPWELSRFQHFILLCLKKEVK